MIRSRRALLVLAALLACGAAQAAKLVVDVTTSTMCTDGSRIASITTVSVEWGSCVGASFGARQSAVGVAYTGIGGMVAISITPSGLNPVCIRAYETGTCEGNPTPSTSDPTNTLSVTLPGALGTPVTLGQPIHLP